jgi:hypothetical protein
MSLLQPIPNWDKPVEPHMPGSEGSVPDMSGKESLPSPTHDHIEPVLGTVEDEDKWPCGDNPSMPGSYGKQPITLPDMGDRRNKASGGGADPYPAKPGAR